MISASPHAHDRSRVDQIMLLVCIALTPATVMGFLLFGWPAILLWLITCLSAVGAEMFCLWLQSMPINRIKDSSALLTGWLLAMTLPPWAPWWIGVGGSLFAIAIGKHLYGGIGQNVFNPAMLARVALLVSFPVQMNTWIQVTPLFSEQAPSLLASIAIVFGQAPIADAYTGATILGQLGATNDARSISYQFSDWLGFGLGSLGETSDLLLLAGGFWLIYKRVISWHIPISLLTMVMLMASIYHSMDSARYASPWLHFCSGSLTLGAFFIATDYVTSPSTNIGKIIFGAGCGFFIFLIRTWGSFPEAVGFSILLMNALTPLIDRAIKPRRYGRDKRGNPLIVANARTED